MYVIFLFLVHRQNQNTSRPSFSVETSRHYSSQFCRLRLRPDVRRWGHGFYFITVSLYHRFVFIGFIWISSKRFLASDLEIMARRRWKIRICLGLGRWKRLRWISQAMRGVRFCRICFLLRCLQIWTFSPVFDLQHRRWCWAASVSTVVISSLQDRSLELTAIPVENPSEMTFSDENKAVDYSLSEIRFGRKFVGNF